MRNWNSVSDYLVIKCNERGGYFKLSIKEANKLAKQSDTEQKDSRLDGRKIRDTILPTYITRHPDYYFGVTKDENYVWCRRRGVLG